MGVVNFESPSPLIFWPSGQVNGLRDSRSHEAYDYGDPLLFACELHFYKSYKTIINA